jgi:hypothetical protein
VSPRLLVASIALSLVAGCATVRTTNPTSSTTSPPPIVTTELSNDPEILLVEARAYLLAEHWADAALRFDKLITALEHEPDEHLYLAGALFLARSRDDRIELEREAARGLLRAWEQVPQAGETPRFHEIERLVQRATLSLQAMKAEQDPEFSAGPSNAIVVHTPGEQDFFLTRTRCGDGLRGVWRRVERHPVHTYLEHHDRLVAACDEGEQTREFWVDTSVWVALVAASDEGDEPPPGYTREEAEALVNRELRRLPVSAFASP